jgi:predicted DCC family thiol-disulfide oxidoreductase YuxK
MTHNETKKTKIVIFFDGVCNLCNGVVNWLILRDQKCLFLYASLQGETAHKTLPSSMTNGLPSIIVKTQDQQLLTQSKAVFYILRNLSFPWKILLIFSWLPTAWTDWLYQKVAQNRYSVFGKRDSCRLPSEKEKQLFLL